MPRILPTRPNLEYLRHQARDLLKAYYAGDSAARQLFAQHLSSTMLYPNANRAPRRVVLAHALLVIAREYGYASWTKLKQHIETIALEQRVLTQTNDGDDSKRLRKIAQQQRIEGMAAQLVTAARQRDLEQVFAAFCVPARDINAIRADLVEHDTYTIVIDALLTSVEHANARIRFWGAQAMDHFADQRCEEPLRRLLHDPVPRVRWAALHSLQCAECKLTPLIPGNDVIATIIDLALDDPSIKVRRVATYELGQVCADPRAVAALDAIRAQATDRAILRGARQALQRHQRAGSYTDDDPK
jgi:hypothetical protein